MGSTEHNVNAKQILCLGNFNLKEEFRQNNLMVKHFDKAKAVDEPS